MTSELARTKIEAADKLYKEWNGEFWPDKLRQYNEGKQWAGFPPSPLQLIHMTKIRAPN